MSRLDTFDWPDRVTPHIGGNVQPIESTETDRWKERLKQYDGPDRHFVYSLECKRRPEYADVSPDDIWGHPDFRAYNKPTARLIEHKSKDNLLEVFSNLHFQGVHPPGQPEQAIPMWLCLALYADKVYYVGETSNLVKRYEAHMATGESTQLFRFFEPTGRVNLLCDCIPRNPGRVERQITARLTSCGRGLHTSVDWEETEVFAYRGPNGTRFDTKTGWENAPPVIKNHPEWRKYWSRRERGETLDFYDPVKMSVF